MFKRFWILLAVLISCALCGCPGGGGNGGANSGELSDAGPIPGPGPVTDPPISFEYAQTDVSCATEQACPINAPQVTGGSVTNFSVEPALPDGLALNADTGAIGGTPTLPSSWTDYLVTGTSRQGPAYARIRIRVVETVQPVLSLNYSEQRPTYTAGTAIDENAPHPQGGPVSQYSISPSLPAGLALSTHTGVISGTPTVPSGQTTYTVTGFAQGVPPTRPNDPNNAQEQLTITVDRADVTPPKPTDLSYAHSWALYALGRPIEPNVAFHNGGEVDAYKVSPTLPAGLSIDQSNGNIVGTPTALTSDCSSDTCAYTIVASGPGGSASTQVRIRVAARRSWVFTPGTMTQPRFGFAQVTLPDGRVLVAGGIANPNDRDNTVLSSAEIYDPNSGTFTPAGSMTAARSNAMAQLLPNGKVLIAGGSGSAGVQAAAELFDPSLSGASRWQATGSMANARANATIALASSGKVVVAGGLGAGKQILRSTEIYDPQTGSWTSGADLKTGVWFASALAMQDGAQIVIPGGRDQQGNVSQSAQVAADPASSWRNIPLSSNGVRAQYGSFIVSPSKALIFGGIDNNFTPLGSIDLYDAASQTWSLFPGQLVLARSAPLVAPLDGNGVLIAGGLQGLLSGVATRAAETLAISPSQGVPADLPTSPMKVIRAFGGASTLPDGSVLVVGGWDNTNADSNAWTATNTAEIYLP